jgi:hypothetical protein
MAVDYRQKAKDLSDNWKEIATKAGLDPSNKNWSQDDWRKFKNQKEKGSQSSDQKNQTAASQYVAGQVPSVSKIDLGDGKSIDVLTQSGDPALDISNATAINQNLLDANLIRITGQQVLLNTTEETRRATEVADRQNIGITRQSEATEYAARESSGATRFAATEAARGAIETQRAASASQERQVSLKGEQDRLTAIEQGAQERLNIGLTGEQQRQTQAQLLAGQERQIGLTGTQQRLTQAQLLAGQERQIGLTGTQQRLTQAQLLSGQERQIGLTGEQQRLTEAERGKQERLGISATGIEQRLTQGQLLSGQERQIEMTGAQQRMLAQEQGRQQRETDMQTEMNKRYKEAKDAAQASRAFRA